MYGWEDENMGEFTTDTFATIESKRYQGRMLRAIPEPDDSPGTLAIFAIVPHPNGCFVVVKLRLHDSWDCLKFGPPMSSEFFATCDEAGAWALEQFDVEDE